MKTCINNTINPCVCAGNYNNVLKLNVKFYFYNNDFFLELTLIQGEHNCVNVIGNEVIALSLPEIFLYK